MFYSDLDHECPLSHVKPLMNTISSNITMCDKFELQRNDYTEIKMGMIIYSSDELNQALTLILEWHSVCKCGVSRIGNLENSEGG